MKIVLLFLVLLNVLFYGWANWVARQPLELEVVTPEPDAPPLVLFEEQYPERAAAQREAREKTARDERLARKAAAEEAARIEEQAQLDAALEAAAQTRGPVDNTTGEPDAMTPIVAVDAAARPDAASAPIAAAEPGATSALTADTQASPPAETDTEAPERAAASVPPSTAAAAEMPAAQAEASLQGEQTQPEASAALAALDDLARAAQEAAPTPTVLSMTRDAPRVARCVALGPFVTLRDSTQASAALRESGLEAVQRLEESPIWVGHWVHLAPTATRAEAIAVVEKLREDGVSDIYIETSGELRNAISLGLFSDAAGAETRAGKIRALGVRPQIRDRFRDGTVYWIDFDLGPGQDVDPAQFAGGSSVRQIKLQERDCGDSAGAG